MSGRLTKPYNYIHSNEAANAKRTFAPFGQAARALKEGKYGDISRHLMRGGGRMFDYFSGATAGMRKVAPAGWRGRADASLLKREKPHLMRTVATRNSGMTRLKVGAARTLTAYAALRVAGMAISGISDALSD